MKVTPQMAAAFREAIEHLRTAPDRAQVSAAAHLRVRGHGEIEHSHAFQLGTLRAVCTNSAAELDRLLTAITTPTRRVRRRTTTRTRRST